MIHIKINYNNEITVPLCLNADGVCDDDVDNMKVNVDGDIIVTLNNGATYNLGQIIGESGIIYKPHIENDERNVFTFTIDDKSLDDEPALVCRMEAL